MTKVAIIYGWSEGPWQGKGLRQALIAASYEIINNPQEADIIIAHSGGCYMLPEKSRANLVLLVGLPYWPGRHPLESLKYKLREESKDWWWVRKTFFNTYYFFRHPLRWIKMWRAWKRFIFPPPTESMNIIVIRNELDHFMHPVKGALLATERGWHLDKVSGHHDDLWINPESYVKKVKEAYGRQ